MRKILGIWIILALVLTSVAAAVPAGPVLAFKAPPAAEISAPSGATAVSGTVWAWGSKGATGLGDGKASDSKVPVPVSGLNDVVDIAAGYLHALALKSDGTVWAWGINNYGQLGDGTTTNRNVPVKVSILSDVVDIAAGQSHSLAVKSDKTVWAWGNNQYGQLGQGGSVRPDGSLSVGNKLAPVKVVGLMPGATAIAGGDRHSLAVRSDGPISDSYIWAWGHNYYGQLGDGTTEQRLLAILMSYLQGEMAIAAGKEHSLALETGRVFAWGAGADGQLGLGNGRQNGLIPKLVPGLTTGVMFVAAGDRHSLAVKSNGTVWAWGNNQYGQLGDNTTTLREVPVQVSGLSGVKAVAAGASHSLALTEDGSVWAWGYNYYGQLGDSTTTNTLVPVRVSGLNGVTAIAARNFYSLAIKSDLTPVSGTAPIAVAPPPSALTPVTGTAPLAPATGTAPIPVTAPAPKTIQTPNAAPLPSTGLVPIAKATPRSAPTKSSSGILVYASPERIAGPASGGVFSLSVWVASGSQVISSGDLSLNFDAAALEMTSITPGNVFGVAPILVQNDYNNTNGTARLVAARGTGSAPPPPPPPPIPAAQVTDATALLPTGGSAQYNDPTALTPSAGGAQGGGAAAATPAAADASEADRILAAIIAAADAEAARILADLNAIANAVASVLGASPPAAPVADTDAPAHHAAEAVSSTYHEAVPVTDGGAASGGGSSAQPPSGIAFGTQGGGGSAAGPPSGNAYFGSVETGFVASNSLATIRFKVKSTAKPGDYQVSISKAGLADAKGQDIQIRLITGSTIAIGGAMKMGDLTGDGVVDYRDLGVFAAAYGASSAQSNFNTGADLNGDGLINYLDLAIFGANYGK